MSSTSKQSLLLLLALIPMLAIGQTAPPAFPTFKPQRPKGSARTGQVNPATPPPAPVMPALPTPETPAAPATGETPAAPDTNSSQSAPTAPTTTPTAGAAANEPATYTYNLVCPMEQILEDPAIGWSALAGRTLLRAAATDAALKATITLKTKAPLTRTEAIMAIEAVLGMNGVTIVPIGDKFAKVVLEANAGTSGATVSTNGVPEMGRYVTQIIQWKYASAQDISQILQPFSKIANSVMIIPSTQTIVLRDYAENVKRMMEMIERIDQPSTFEMKPEIIPIKYALASDISQVLSSLGGSGGVSVGGHTSSGLSGGSFRGSSSSTMNPGGMNTPGSSGYTGSTMGGTSGGGGARSTFQSKLANLVSKASSAASGDFQILGQSKIIADERTNSLLVFANKEDMEMIKLIISKLDVVLAQVLIEAIIMEVSLGDNRDIGISYLQKQKNFGSGSYPITAIGGLNNNKASDVASQLLGSGTNSAGSFPGGFSYLTSLNKDLDIVATAIAGDSRANVLSRPRIQTSHAVAANLFVGQTRPYVTGTYFNGGYAGGNSSQYTQKEVGITLEVLPLINPDGLVVMDIRSDIEDLGEDILIDNNKVPSTIKRVAEAKVAVRDRETIMLGGFISNSRSKSHSGIPVLMDIPFLGALFRSNSEKNNKVELIVLLRPSVLPTPQAAAVFASEERNKMSGVKAAEYEIRESERKSNEAIEKQLKKEADAKTKKEKKEASKGTKSTELTPAWQEPSTAPKSPTQSGTHIEE